jgi:sugar phosphate isomerase/epimerase
VIRAGGAVPIAVSTVSFPGIALMDLPEAAREVGAEALALGAGPGGPLALDATTSTVAAFLGRCAAVGVSVSAVYGYAGRALCSDPGAAHRDADLARRCIDLAALLGAPVCRMFAGTAPGDEAAIDRFVAACRPVADHAAAAGLLIGFPTHHDLASDPASCRRLVEGLGRDRVGIIFTGPNLELDGIDPLSAWAEMADLVLQVETKDWRRDGPKAHPVAIGTGEATVWPLLERMAGSGFKGWITLHHLRQHHPEMGPLSPDVAGQVREIIAKAGTQ